MSADVSDVWKFENELKSRISIADLYTRLTGIQFSVHKGAPRAMTAWRHDNDPSLHFHPGKNILTDFADEATYTGKLGAIYNHFTLFEKLQLANSHREAVEKLSEIVGTPVPADLRNQIVKMNRERDALNQTWKACQAFAMGIFNAPDQYPIVRAFCEDRGFPFDRDFWTTMQIGLWPMASILDRIKEEFKLNDKHAKLKINAPVEYESRALVFPQHNASGVLTGLTVRAISSKRFLQFRVSDDGIYGALDAVPETHAIITEGQLGRVQIGAAIWRMFGKDQFRENLPSIVSTGSNNFDMRPFKGVWERCIYAPDYDIRLQENDKKKKEIFDTTMYVYNRLQCPEFKAVYWPNLEAYDKYDADDFFHERIGKEDEAIKTFHSYSCTMPEFTLKWIERKTAHLRDDKERNSATYAYAHNYAQQFYNLADRHELKTSFDFINPEDLDQVVIDRTSANTEIQLAEDLFMIGNAYWLEYGPSDDRQRFKLSNFVIRPRYKVISKPKADEEIGEFEDRAPEVHAIRAEICFENGTRSPITFHHTDMIDVRSFVSCMAKNSMQARQSMPADKRVINVLQAILITLETPETRLQLRTAGPHLRYDSPEHRRTTLRPNWFGDNVGTKTFLNRGCSIINGTIMPNQNVNIEFTTFDCYNFGTYSDEEHARISKLIWEKMHRLHKPWFIKTMLGAACMTPIKHLLNPRLNGVAIALFGQSNTRKTSTAAIMNNFFGDIASDSQLMNFNSTAKAFETRAAQAGAVFVVCDEFIPHKDFTMEHLGTVFHNMYSGRTKARLHTTAELQTTYPYTGTYIITGEFSDKLRASTEARILAYRAEEHNAEEIYLELVRPENLQKYKCWMPRLIAWQHLNLDKLCAYYAERQKALRKKLGDVQNANRVSDQQALIETGYYAYIQYNIEQGFIKEEDGLAQLQEYLIWTEQNVHEQLFRSSSSTFYERFLQYFKELVETGAINIARITGEGQQRDVHFTQDSKRPFYVVSYEHKKMRKFAIVSFEALLREMNRAYGGDVPFTMSIKSDLHEHEIIKLDAKGQFPPVEYPDPFNPKVFKRGRVMVLTEADVYRGLDADASEYQQL